MRSSGKRSQQISRRCLCDLRTKISDHVNEVLHNGYQLITFPQVDGHQRSLTSPRTRPFLLKYYALSDRVAALWEEQDTNQIRIIVAYGPILKTSTENHQLREVFYDAITSVWLETANGRSLCFIAGDFNSKVGLWLSTVLEECMGRYGKGPGNDNGQALVDWAIHIQVGAFPTFIQTSNHLDRLDEGSAKEDEATILRPGRLNPVLDEAQTLAI